MDEEDWTTSPWNFSWVVKDKLAGMAWPQTPANIRYIYDQGIRHLVTLSPEMRPPIRHKLFEKISWTEIGIKEFESPTLAQIWKFIEVCKDAHAKNEAVGVHCRKGRGRTGVMASCYLVYFYEQAPERAIINVRLMRPGSVETYQQERIVHSFHDFLRGTTINDPLSPKQSMFK